METNSQTGSGSVSAFFVIFLIVSLALNAAFLTGCNPLKNFFGGGGKDPRPTSQQGLTSPASEAAYLREIATVLRLSPSSDKTPGDVAFDIKQALGNAQTYRGEVFTDKDFEECKAAIPTAKETETFMSYHAFISKIAGKTIIVLE